MRIICKAEGFPAPNYTIFHNGIKVTDNGIKIVKSVNSHDGGRYEIMAMNSIGNVSEHFNLEVEVEGRICFKTCLAEMVSACDENGSLMKLQKCCL